MVREKGEQPVTFRIEVEGLLDRKWSEWFGNMTLHPVREGMPSPRTVLEGPVSDQTALIGILQRIVHMNLRLISVRRGE